MSAGNAWAEQDWVYEWARRHGIERNVPAFLELSQKLTEPRLDGRESYPSEWARVVLMVSPSGEMHAIGGDQASGDPDADRPYIGLERIRSASKSRTPTPPSLREAVEALERVVNRTFPTFAMHPEEYLRIEASDSHLRQQVRDEINEYLACRAGIAELATLRARLEQVEQRNRLLETTLAAKRITIDTMQERIDAARERTQGGGE